MESGSESVLQRLNKGIHIDQVVKACDLTRRTGMQLSIYLITGTHGESAEDVAATLRLVRRLRPHDGVVSPLVVYPGTALYEETKRIKGCDDTIWERTRMEGLLVREDSESILAYRQVEATLREVSATSAYTIQELEGHKRTVGSYTAPLLSLGEAYEAEGMTERAAGEYREILARNPESLWGHLRLGNLAEGKGDPAGAAAHYRRAVAAVPRYHLAHSLLGSALRRMGSREESEREFLMALSLYPKDRVARRGLGLLHLPQRGSSGRAPSFQRKPSSGLTASPTWPSFLKHPIPDGQPLPGDTDP